MRGCDVLKPSTIQMTTTTMNIHVMWLGHARTSIDFYKEAEKNTEKLFPTPSTIGSELHELSLHATVADGESWTENVSLLGRVLRSAMFISECQRKNFVNEEIVNHFDFGFSF